jgi:hypothetical protein
LKIDYRNGAGSGGVLWKLGYQGDFTLQNPNSDADWFFAQHDPNFVSSNSTGNVQLAMFDNGDGRPVDSNGSQCAGLVPPYCFSTAAIFHIDETARTATRWWSYTTPYSWWGGSTRVLSNSNVFVDETAPGDLGLTASRVIEVTQSPNPRVVRTMEITGQNSYRTIHLPSLYPGVQW